MAATYLTIESNFYYNDKLFKAQTQYTVFEKTCVESGCGCAGKGKTQVCTWNITDNGKTYAIPEAFAFESNIKLDTTPPNSDVFQDAYDYGRGKDSKKSNMYHDKHTNYKSIQNRNSSAAIRAAADDIPM
jgi:hypothetical protein|tara:strand:+ start:1667 stop:2056 length:390 start_codon:yes stop_codon:yes gene_type:complete